LRNPRLLTCLLIAGAALMAFWEVQEHEFLIYDDPRYVVENAHVRNGLTLEGTRWAFTNLEAGFWHPFTWLSHMLDSELYGLNPKGHHWTNLVLHIINSIILFLLLDRWTGKLARSGFVALLFALHPLHVESVAWISQRKDVLSTLFWFFTLWAYTRYAGGGSRRWYAVTLFGFTAGLMAKSMLVTLPFMLILLDYWPLGRTNGLAPRSISPLLPEKVPFLALSLIFVVLTFQGEKEIGALPSLASVPFGHRVSNAVVSYASYILKMCWPRHLAVIYPLPSTFSVWQVMGGALLLAAVSVGTFLLRKKWPFLLVGWLWYVGTLLPVIGLVQIGSHAMADRYTYVPLIGPFIMVAWGIPRLLRPFNGPRRYVPPTAACAVLLGLTMITWVQVKHWQNSVEIFRQAVTVTPDHFLARSHLGYALALEGKNREAVEHLEEALRIRPGYVDSRYHLANALQALGQEEEAIRQYLLIIQAEPLLEKPHFHIGNAYLTIGRNREAIQHYTRALEINPGNAQTHNNLAIALGREGRMQEAHRHLSEALRLDPLGKKGLGNLKRLPLERPEPGAGDPSNPRVP
jgi:Flp pilus assembly protein TadD